MIRQGRLIVDTILLGVVGALSAQAFIFLLKVFQWFFMTFLAGYEAPGVPGEGGVLKEVIGPHGLWLIPVATTLGGLISGFLVYSLAPEAEGHGTDSAVKAYHHTGGFLRPRVTPLKMLTSAITIGSGGAAGREGPTALIAAGIGSIYATLGRRSEENRRLLVLVGMAAGLSAIFRSPIGTALFAIEVLYSGIEFEAGALLYALLGAIVAYVLNGMFVGWEPLFHVSEHLGVQAPIEYFWFAALGVISGLMGVVLPVIFYRVRDAFHALPGPPHIKPAIGGLGIGILALWIPQVLGGGYGWIQEAMGGFLPLSLLLLLPLGKLLAFSLTVSSGGSGGIFAPSLYVGAMLGGCLAQVLHMPPAAFVVVGMAAVFGGAARVPVATLMMVTEMTGGYHLLAPAALAVALSCLVQVGLSSRLTYHSLYEAQVPGRSDSPAHQVEHLRVALRLLHRGQIPASAAFEHISLVSLLKTGAAVDLPDGRQLFAGVLFPESPFVGKPIPLEVLDDVDAEIAAIVRGQHVVLPRSDTVLQAGDRLLVIAPPRGWEGLDLHLIPLPEWEESMGQT